MVSAFENKILNDMYRKLANELDHDFTNFIKKVIDDVSKCMDKVQKIVSYLLLVQKKLA